MGWTVRSAEFEYLQLVQMIISAFVITNTDDRMEKTLCILPSLWSTIKQNTVQWKKRSLNSQGALSSAFFFFFFPPSLRPFWSLYGTPCVHTVTVQISVLALVYPGVCWKRFNNSLLWGKKMHEHLYVHNFYWWKGVWSTQLMKIIKYAILSLL